MVNLLDFCFNSRIIQFIHESVPELPGECVRIGRSGRDTHVQVLDSEISASPSTALRSSPEEIDEIGISCDFGGNYGLTLVHPGKS